MFRVKKVVFAYLCAAILVVVGTHYLALRHLSVDQRLVQPISEFVQQSMSRASANSLIQVDVEQIPAGFSERGTAFPLGKGIWLTARHVAGDGCGQIILIVKGAKVPAELKYLDPNADLAVLQARSGSEAALPIERSTVRENESAFAFGFPQGYVGGTEDELMGRARLKLGGRLTGTAPVLAWVEIQRYPASIDSLAGISGGPMLDEKGNVVGIIVAASVRRGRNYTVAPEILREIQHELGLASNGIPIRGAVSEPVSLEASANALNESSTMAETYCVPP